MVGFSKTALNECSTERVLLISEAMTIFPFALKYSFRALISPQAKSNKIANRSRELFSETILTHSREPLSSYSFTIWISEVDIF